MKKLVVFLSLFAGVANADPVTAVKVVALDKFGGDTSSVTSYSQVKVGKEYDPTVLTRDVKSMRDSREFETVDADVEKTGEGVEVTFRVRRKLRYHAPIEVTGAEFFGENEIADKAGLKDGFLYGEADFAAAARKVREAYYGKHFPDARVEISTVPIAGNDCRVRFEISEGARIKRHRVTFDGIEDPEVNEFELRKAVGDFPWWHPAGWFSDALASAEQQAGACETIAKYYRDLGYLDVRVSGPERVPYREDRCDLCYTIVEGVRYCVGSVAIRGLERYTEAEILAIMAQQESALPESGAVAGAKYLSDIAKRIEIAVGSGQAGLADTLVEVREVPNVGDSSVVDIVFQVTEGVPVVVDEVKIQGNDYTKDKVIRREILLGPDSPMNADQAEQSKRKLENLDYFSRVNYKLVPSGRGKNDAGAEYRNLVFEVEEKNTGNFMVGVGASSVDSVFLSAEISQSNFDLFAPGRWFRGGGQKGRLYASWGPRIQTFEGGVSEPYLFGRQLELSVDAYRRLRWYDDYDIIRSGAAASISYPVKFFPQQKKAFGRLGFRLSGEYIEFDDVDEGIYEYKDKTVSLTDEEDEFGGAFEPVLRVFWAKDSRTSFHAAQKGHYTQLFGDVAPATKNQYWRLGLHHRSYFPVFPEYNHVFMVGLRAETIGAISGDVAIYNRMFLGGPRSIRGVKYRNVAPMARKLASDDYIPWGGQSLFCMNFEYTVPIVRMLRLAVFSDLGSVGEDDFDLDFSHTFAWTVGLGVRLDLPMFPIRLDFATPVKKPDEAEDEVFSFLIGYDF